jgi:hypothetical protein
MAGDAYEQGRHQQVYTGGDWNDYQRGQQDRARWQAATAPTGPARGPGAGASAGADGGGAGGVGGLALLALLLAVAAVAAAAALLALPLALLLCVAMARWPAGAAAPARFGQTYRAAFFAALASLLLTLVVGFALQVFDRVAFDPGGLDELRAVAAALVRCVLRLLLAPWGLAERLPIPPGDWAVVLRAPAPMLVGAVLMWQSLPAVGVALALRRCLPGRFPGWIRLSLAGALGTAAVLASMPLLAWGVAAGAGQMQHMHWPLGLLGADVWATLAPRMVLWALLAGLVLAAVMEVRIRRHGGASRLLRLYLVSVLICLGFGVVLLGTLAMSRDAGPVLAALWRATGPGTPAMVAPLGSSALAGWALLQCPAVLAAAALVSTLVGGRFRGLPGFVWAVVLSAPVLVGSAWLAIGLAMWRVQA